MTTDPTPETPCTIPVRLACPKCNQALVVEMEVTATLFVTQDMDEVSEAILKPKVRLQSIAHMCGQRTLDDALTAPA